jgi:hypothetical protein
MLSYVQTRYFLMTLFIFLQETVCIPLEMFDEWSPIEEFESADVDCDVNNDDANQMGSEAIDESEVIFSLCFI